MKNLIEEYKKPFLVALSAMVIFAFFLKPIISYIGYLITGTFVSINNKFEKDFYGQLGQLETNDISFFILAYTFAVFIGISLGLFTSVSTILFRKNKKDTSSKKRKNLTKYHLALILLFLLSMSGCLIFFISTRFYMVSLATDFRTNFKIISPYISEQEEELFLSEWTLMKSKNDHLRIVKKINEISKKNNIILPENKVYSLTSF